MEPRFTLDGSPTLEAGLRRVCADVEQRLRAVVPPRQLEAVLLGGGYGRGEGGVLRRPEGDAPYNDLEFYICARGPRAWNERRWSGALREAARELSARASLEVEFKLISLAHLRRSPVTMFYYDLVMGHRWLVGEESLLAGCEHHRRAETIPAAEATRLLLNRCTGLLFARERLARPDFNADDADFAGRNLAKAQLGLGDAVLTLLGQYHWSCRERGERVRRLRLSEPWWEAACRHHARGVEFKLHPETNRGSRERLTAWWEELAGLGLQVWLWVESRRLKQAFASPREYAVSTVNKCPESNGWRNGLIHLTRFGPAACWRAGAWRYPRERALQALPLLLWEPRWEDPAWLRLVQSHLWTAAGSRSGLMAAYQRLWEPYR